MTDAPVYDAPRLARYGYPEYVKGASPAAGAHFTQAIGGGFFTRLVSLSARLVTSAAIANREVVVQYLDDDSTVYHQDGINTVVTASNTADYFFSVFTPEAVATVNNSALVPLAGIMLPPTHSIRVFVVNIQAADQLSLVRFVQERFYTTGQPPGE